MQQETIKHLWGELLLPSDYALKSIQAVKHDELAIHWVHYRKDDSLQYVNFIFNQNRLQGFMVMDQTLQCGALPEEQEAKVIACDFINRHAPDLVNDLELKWIAPHEEILSINNKDIIITGMKVKCRIKSTGKFAWVIIGKNREPICFERDIVWNYDMSERQTERWLIKYI